MSCSLSADELLEIERFACKTFFDATAPDSYTTLSSTQSLGRCAADFFFNASNFFD
jgi:hypothetical protein